MQSSSIIIYGYSKISSEVASLLLKKGYKFTIIEDNKSNLKRAIDDGYSAYMSNLSEDENLIEAGVTKRVKTIFCMSEDFNKNLFVTLSSRALDKELNIISISSSKEGEKKMLLAGANRVINPYEIGAQRLFRFMRRPILFLVLDRILFGESDIKFFEILISKNSSFIGMELKDVSSSLNSLLLIGLKSQHGFIYDTNRTRYSVKRGDILVVMGRENDIKEYKKEYL